MTHDERREQHRREDEERINGLVADVQEVKEELASNTAKTEANTTQIAALRGELSEVNVKTDTLLEMKQAFDQHLSVICFWAKWAKRTLYAMIGFAGAILPVGKQLGWW
jgi:chromosome segregation ATPase